MKTPACSVCGKDSAIRLAYAARSLCQGCFVKHFERRVHKTVSEFGMIKKGERIAVGLSGGKDSVVMLRLLAAYRKRMPFDLVAITIDEGIRGYRARTLKVAKKECKRLGIHLKILSFEKDIGYGLDRIMEIKKGMACSWCGVFRRYLLNKGAREAKADKIAIGHNLDDVAQTVLMNIMRNEPARLARFLDPQERGDEFVPRIRPLLRTPEREVAAYALMKGIGIDFLECPYAHFAFRQHVKHQLNETEERYPGAKVRILNSYITMEKWMRDGAKKEISGEPEECPRCKEASGKGLCMKCRMVDEIERAST